MSGSISAPNQDSFCKEKKENAGSQMAGTEKLFKNGATKVTRMQHIVILTIIQLFKLL